MLYKSFSLLSLILLGDVMNCQAYVTIVTNADVQQDALSLRCHPIGVAHYGTITDITLWKNSASGWNRIVKIWLKIENDTVDNAITWTDTEISNRATIINKKISPSIHADLQIEISPIKCSDKGDYKCSIRGNSDSSILNSESLTKTVGMRAEPASINPIQVQPQQHNNTYNPNTSVKLTCNGNVVNHTSNLRWCIRTTGSNKMGDFTVYGDTNDITHGKPTLSDCQYRQQSVLTYNILTTIPQADFRCETGGTSTTCGHSSAISANYTIYSCKVVNCQVYVEIATDNEVKYQQEKLTFTCSPKGAALTGTITDITLWKFSPSGWKEIVNISLGISNGQFANEITWINTDIGNRSNIVNHKVYPSNQAGLKIEIKPTNVRCSDKGKYKCSISGNSDSISGSVRLVSESAPKNVKMSGDDEKCPVDVIIAADNEVKYQQEKLPFTCSPTGAALTGTITDITLWKNSPSGWKRIVMISLAISKGQYVNEITWTNTDIRDRSNIVNRKVYPWNQAGLQIEIRPTNVTCSDQGEYKCSISGYNDSIPGSPRLINESTPTNVVMSGDALNCQVTFATDMDVLYQQEKLPFTCIPRGAALMGTITDITLLKNSASGWKQIVRTWLSIENGKVANKIEWANTDIKNHATIINQKVSPSSQAGLEIEITPVNVKYSDKGDYKCSISGNSGSISISSESAPKTVAILVATNISSGNLFPNPINYFVLCIMYSSIL